MSIICPSALYWPATTSFEVFLKKTLKCPQWAAQLFEWQLSCHRHADKGDVKHFVLPCCRLILIRMSFLKKSQSVIPECKLCFRSLKPRFPETTVKTCPLLWVLSCGFRYSPGCGGTQQGGADLNSVSKLSCSLILSLECLPPPSLLKENLQRWEQPFASCKNCIMSYLSSL